MKELNDALVLAGVERIVNDLQRVAKARKMHIMAVEFMMRSRTWHAQDITRMISCTGHFFLHFGAFICTVV